MNCTRLSLWLMPLFLAFLPAQAASFGLATDPDTLLLHLSSKSDRWQPAGVIVRLKGKEVLARSDAQGRVLIPDLSPGKYVLELEGEGFRPIEQKIEPKHFSNQPLKVTMLPYWSISGTESLYFSQAAFGTYWQAGGLNSVTIGGRINLNATHKKGKGSWENTLNLAYGFIKQAEHDFIKNEDEIVFTSKYGRKFSPNLLFTALLDLRTQFAPGFKINKDGSRGNLRSRFFAPAYINLGTGLDYQLKAAGLSIYYSPINSKMTLVRDTSLTALYMPEEIADQTGRYELGSYLNIKYKKEIWKNVVLQTKADVFTNHLDNFGSFDINWETQMAFKVNKFLTANVLTQVVYDDDIKFAIVGKDGEPERNEFGELTGRKGPRTQLREMLNIGLVHKF